MSKTNGPNSVNPNYEVGYKRPPVSRQFKPGRSGNPRGRPSKTGARSHSIASGELSELHRMLLDVGARPVEVRRGGRTVKMTQLEAVVEGLAAAGQQGNVRAAQIFIEKHSEAVVEAQRKSVVSAEGVELTLEISRILRTERIRKQEHAALIARIAELESMNHEEVDKAKVNVDPAVEPPPPPSFERSGSSHQVSAPAACTAPQPLGVPTPSQAVSAKAPRPPRRPGDPLIQNNNPIWAGSWGVNG